MIDIGYIALHRKFNQWEWKSDPNMVALFIHLLVNANYVPKSWQGQIIERGQVVIGRKQLSLDTGISEQTIRTCLNKLKSTSEITIKPTNKFSILTIVNYDKYQGGQTESTSRSTSKLTNNQPTTNQQLTTMEEVNKEINKKKKKYITREKIDFDFDSSEWINITPEKIELWEKAYPACDIQLCLNQMATWLVANPTKVKSAYDRFITNWLKKEQDRGGNKSKTTVKKGKLRTYKEIYGEDGLTDAQREFEKC